ncbi:hypothetical protein MTsPCn3_05330 [Erythrobacter sp. MTPC3]
MLLSDAEGEEPSGEAQPDPLGSPVPVGPDGSLLPDRAALIELSGKSLPPALMDGLPVFQDARQAPETTVTIPSEQSPDPAKPDLQFNARPGPENRHPDAHKPARNFPQKFASGAASTEAAAVLKTAAPQSNEIAVPSPLNAAEPSEAQNSTNAAATPRFVMPSDQSTQQRAMPEAAKQLAQANAAASSRAAEPAPIAPARAESAPHHSVEIALTASTPAPNSPSPASPTSALIDTARPLETLIDNLVQARENGRAARGDMILRHAEFGAVALHIDRSDADVKAVVSSRDPGFAPAAQAALAERAQAVQHVQNASQTEQSQTSGHGRDGPWSHNGEHGEHGGRGERGEQEQQSDPRRSQDGMIDQPHHEQHPQSPSERGTFA